jgi:eight-cysteine-cluster-containing protein
MTFLLAYADLNVGNVSPAPLPPSVPVAPGPAPSPEPVPAPIVPPGETVKGDCRSTGCSGEICSDQNLASTCIYRPEYACYKSASCERQSDGKCGWTMTGELKGCLEGTAK